MSVIGMLIQGMTGASSKASRLVSRMQTEEIVEAEVGITRPALDDPQMAYQPQYSAFAIDPRKFHITSTVHNRSDPNRPHQLSNLPLIEAPTTMPMTPAQFLDWLAANPMPNTIDHVAPEQHFRRISAREWSNATRVLKEEFNEHLNERRRIFNHLRIRRRRPRILLICNPSVGFR